MEVFEQLGIEPGVMLVNLAGFLLVFALLKKFAFGPVGEIFGERQREVAANLDEAERNKQLALADKRKIEEELDSLDERAEDIIAEAEDAAEQRRTEILNRADEQSRQIIEDGQAAVEHATEQARQQLREETTQIAVEVSQSALQQALDEERQAALVDAFIDDIERIAQEQSEAEPT